MPTKSPKAGGDARKQALRENLRDLKAELEISKAAFKDDLFTWAAKAIASYLDGPHKTLDAAFSGAKTGRPPEAYSKKAEVQKAIARDRSAGEKWEILAARHGVDPRQALREYHRGIDLLRQEANDEFAREVERRVKKAADARSRPPLKPRSSR